jgi:hypothetical protein
VYAAYRHDSMESMSSFGTPGLRRKAHAEPEGGGMRKRVLAFGREDRGVSTIPLLPPTGGKNMPEDDHDSAAPTAATVVEVCKIYQSHLRAVGAAAMGPGGIAADNRYCCC